jgi:hypothetical protein
MKTYTITLPDHVDAVVRRRAAENSTTVELFISGYLGDHLIMEPLFRPKPEPTLKPVVTPKESEAKKLSVVRVRDREFKNANAKECLVDVLNHLAKTQPDFFDRCDRNPRMHGRTRNYIARSIDKLYPGRPDLAENHASLNGGWYLATNINNDVKKTILKAAFETAGLVAGRDYSILLA